MLEKRLSRYRAGVVSPITPQDNTYMKVEFRFLTKEVIAMLREKGLTVEMEDVPTVFKYYNGQEYSLDIPTWMVHDPNGKEKVSLETFFKAYVEQKKRSLFLEPTGLELYMIFPQLNKHPQS